MQSRLPLPLLAAAVAEGAARVTIFVYGPLFLLQELRESQFVIVALSAGLSSLATFIMANVWGRLGDRKKLSLSIVTIGMGGAAIALALLPLAAATWSFFLLSILCCAAMAAVAPLGVAWASTVPLERQGREIARFYRTRSFGWAIGSFGSSWLLRESASTGLSDVYRFSAALALAATIWLLYSGITNSRAPVRAGTIEDDRELPGSFEGKENAPRSTGIWRQPIVVAITVTVFLSLGSNETFFSLIAPYFTGYLHGPEAWIGLAMGFASVVGIVATGMIGRLVDRRGPLMVLMIGVCAYIGVYGLMATFRQPLVAVVLFAVPAYPFIATGVTGTLARITPLSRRGEAMGIYEGSAALASTTGSLSGGVVVDVLGLGALPVASFVLAILGACVAWLGVFHRIRTTASAVESQSH